MKKVRSGLKGAALLAFLVPLAFAPERAGADVREWLERFSSVPSRYLGTPGHRMTLREVEAAFRRFGLKRIRRERLTVTAPVEEEAWISGPGITQTRLHAVWPNHVQNSTTPREGVTGPLVHAGRGEAAALNGQPVEGAIALVELPCSERPQGWLTPFLLGAAAVIFLPPPEPSFTRADAEELFLAVPADLPRFWAPASAAGVLRLAASRQARATVRSRVAWKEIVTYNILGTLPGADGRFPAPGGHDPGKWRERHVILQAYTDSMSVVPALAPGAEQAGGLVGLMELAEHFSRNPVPPTLTFLATSGHHHSLSGIHEFLARHIRQEQHFTRSITAEEEIEADYIIGLDLSSGDSRVAAFSQGTFYTGWEHDLVAQNAMLRLARLLDVHAAGIFGKGVSSRYLNAVSPPRRAWKDFLGYPAAFDAEAAIYTGTPALTFATAFDARMRVDTPLDTPERADPEALALQIDALKSILSSALADPGFFGTVRMRIPDRGRALRGTVHEFERTVTGLPDKPVPGALVAIRMGKQAERRKTYGPVRGLYATFSRDDDPMTLTVTETGSFYVPILRTDEFWKWIHIVMEGYTFNEDGKINLAADLGPLVDQFNPDIWFQEREKLTLLVLNRCRPLTILEPVDARQLRFLDGLTVRDGRDQPFMNFGYSFIAEQSKAQESFTPAVVIFAPDLPDAEPRIKALMQCGSLGIRGIFTGADESLIDDPKGEISDEQARGGGYSVGRGVLRRAPYEGAKDMWILDHYRGSTLERHHVHNVRIESLHDMALSALQRAKVAWAQRRYDEFLTNAREAWGLESRAYPEFKAVANDLVKTVVFYCVLLLPFAFCMERLFFSFPDLRRQLLSTGAIFLAGFLALRQVHPAFQISSNPVIIFLGFIIMALGLVVLAIISSKFQRELRRIKGERGDYEAVDIGRISATIAAVTLGLSNLRKRPLRTGLTMVTVVVLTFTVLSLVSMSSTVSFFRLPRGIRPAYAGALVRETAWQVLQPPVKKYIHSALDSIAYVVPRGWVTARQRDELLQLEVTADSGNRGTVSGLLGLAPEERHVLRPNRNIGLRGRWFRSGEMRACLVPEVIADRLGIGVGDSLHVRGERLEVIGLFQGRLLDELKDLDGEPVTPAKFEIRRSRYNWEPEQEPPRPEGPGEGFATTDHLSGNRVLIVPYEMAMMLEGRLRSIAIVPRKSMESEELMESVREFLVRAALIALVSNGERVDLLTSIGAVSVSGTFDLILPILLVGLIVLNTMMGSVHERVKEISIFSSVGLAPVHIGALFFAEAFVVAIVGVVLGYLGAQFTAAILLELKPDSLAGLSLNYSSSAAVGACVIVIGAVMISTIYPARRAAEMAVPDVTRRWRLPDPVDDALSFDFPFTVGHADLVGLFAYLADLFRAYRDSSIGSFAADRVRLSRTSGGVALSFDCWLAPYDLGISQEVRFEAIPMEIAGLYRVHVHMARRSGEAQSWHRQNRRFLTALRKRFMIWRMFGPDLREKYARGGRLEMGEADG